MTKEEIKRKVVGQLINMLDNDIMTGYGTGSFLGWLEDGEVFRLNGHSEEEVKELMEFAGKIAMQVDNLVWQIENGGEL